MFIHHLATLALLTLSWSNHMHRMGSLVLIVHDFADHWLELAKLFRYAGWAATCDACFAVFTIVWAFSRLGLFPSWVIYSTVVEAAQVSVRGFGHNKFLNYFHKNCGNLFISLYDILNVYIIQSPKDTNELY